MPLESNRSWTAMGKIDSGKCRLELAHSRGHLTLEFHYFNEASVVTAQIDSLSADLEQETRRYAFRLQDLPLLLEHAAQILRQSIEQNLRKSPAACPVNRGCRS